MTYNVFGGMLNLAQFNSIYVADDLGWLQTPKPPKFVHFAFPFISCNGWTYRFQIWYAWWLCQIPAMDDNPSV